MIQILKLREFVRDNKTIKFDKLLEIEFPSTISELFQNLKVILDQVPISEQYNLFFTPANCTNKKREFLSSSVIFFDIDGINTDLLDDYINIVTSTLKIKKEETAIVFSGNGLHFYIELQVPIVDKQFFDVARPHYKALCDLINKSLAEANLPGSTDTAVFDARRLMRLPGTVNRKPGKPERLAKLLQSNLVATNFDVTALSGLPTVNHEEQISPEYLAKFPKVYNEEVLKNCAFLQNCQENPAEITEPEWYAMLSITARLENGRELSHKISEGHPNYSFKETDIKIDQALKSSGPRKCKSISNLTSVCLKCPHFSKDSSPILLKPVDAILTETTGFHDIAFDPQTGGYKIGKPNFIDLAKFFEREHAYVSHSKLVWIWMGTHWKEITNHQILNFALKHFKPFATSKTRNEFLDLIQIKNNLDNPSEWSNETFGKINLENGVLNVATGELMPHSKDMGFKYCLPYSYDQKAKAPNFKKFLHEVTEGDEIKINTLLEFGGYALAGGECKYQKALVLDGEGQNGKSTFIEVLCAVAGKGNYSNLSFLELQQPDRRSVLDGALFNITEETPTKLTDTTVFKNLVSGGSISVRKLYKDNYFVRNKTKLIFSCNKMPTTLDSSYGMLRRLLIVPFTATFSHKNANIDVNIKDKLLAELPGILNLFVEAYKKLIVNNEFTKSAQAEDEDIEEYRKVSDVIYAWKNERIEIVKEGIDRVQTKDLFADFKEWAEMVNFDIREINIFLFSRELGKILGKNLRTRIGTNSSGFKNVMLREREF